MSHVEDLGAALIRFQRLGGHVKFYKSGGFLGLFRKERVRISWHGREICDEPTSVFNDENKARELIDILRVKTMGEYRKRTKRGRR